MIPKIAHFHWTGPPMSWLRMAGIATFVKHNPDWQVRIIGTPPDIRGRNLKHYGQEADWTWWRTLYEVGGFQVATDIVFVAPVPKEWLDCDINCCLNGNKTIYQFGMAGARPGLEYFSRLEQACSTMAIQSRPSEYQSMGVGLLRRHAIPEDVEVFDQPMDATCIIRCTEIDRFWQHDDLPRTGDVIGYHWYGDHPESKLGQHVTDEDSAIVKIAMSELT